MTQQGLFDAPRISTLPFARNSETSREAAESMEASAGTLRAKVLRVIREAGERGLTADELEFQTGLKHTTASARMRELKLSGQIVSTGEKRKTRSNRNAEAWRAAS